MRVFTTLLIATLITSASAQPCADFVACFQASASGESAFFFNNCTPNIDNTQFIWSFGDGEQSTAVAPTHTYSAPGQYEVCLTAYLEECEDSTCAIVIVEVDPCVELMADFNWNSTPNNVFFSNSTTGTGTSTTFAWDFGDGQSSNDAQADHTYTDPGVYEVCLLVISNYMTNGGQIACTAQECKLIQVGEAPPCDPDFEVVMAVIGVAGSEAQFVATSNQPETYFNWAFGDGSEGYGPQVTHTYAQPGTYDVCVFGWYYNELAGDSCWTEACGTVMVEGGDPCGMYESCFEAAPLTGQSYFFINCSTLSFESTTLWEFGDGTTSTQFGPIHTYPGPGTYTTCLTTTWPGCVEQFCVDVIVGGDPCNEFEACFVTTPLQQPGSFFFDNCSQGQQGTQYLWDFGDGTISTGTNVDHNFATPGSYTVCLSAAWQSCTDSICTVVNVGGDPCADLEADFIHFTTPNGTAFSNSTSGAGLQTSFFWTFGDGTSSTDPQPFHTYAEDGVYEACLQAISIFELPNGGLITCVDTTCAIITIGDPNPCDALDPSFYYSGGIGGVNFGHDLINFAWTYHWYFGDGTEGFGPSPYHVFPAAGTYQACLVLSTWDPVSQDSCYADHCETIIISDDPCDELEACILVNDVNDGTFLFENCSSFIQGGQFVWDMGDGTQVNDVIAIHTYDQPGTYTVCLTAYWQNCVDTTCTTVVVPGELCEDLVACFEPLPFENGVYFFQNCSQVLPIDIPEFYFWDFGDGSSSAEAEPDHSFLPGTYTVCLTVEQGDCVDSTCMTITVGGTNPCDELDAGFIASGGITGMNFANDVIDLSWTYLWSFGDGTQADGPNPFHVFPEAGTYQVCLVVYTWDPIAQDTCFADHCEAITVGGEFCDGLLACFDPQPFENGVYFFQNCSQELPIGSAANYTWDFGDGSTSNEFETEHSFQPGTYTVCLTIEQGVCSDSFCTTITVGPGLGCNPNYEVSFTWFDQGTAVTFVGTSNMNTEDYLWDFGDGSDEGYGQNITHLYEPPGPYEVCVSAWYWNEIEQDTCWASHCELVDPFDTGINHLNASTIAVYPVPATGSITITGLVAKDQLRLFSADGRLVINRSATGTMDVMDVGGLATGTYVLWVNSSGGTSHHKVIVQ